MLHWCLSYYYGYQLCSMCAHAQGEGGQGSGCGSS